MKTVLVLGGSFGGVPTAHKMLKQAPKTGDVKVILVSKSTHFYFNLATPRAIIPGQFADEKYFQALAPGFKQYGEKFELIIGTAEKIDVAAKNVLVSTSDGRKVISYDDLVLATGSSTIGDVPWKACGSYGATRDAIHGFQAKVKKARSIVIGGAGPTGVETAGELGFEYGEVKKITLVSSGAQVLEGTPPSVSKVATKLLKAVNVTITPSTKILGSITTPDGRTELTLSDGQKITTDLYLPTTGLIPNSSYIPRRFLNQNGYVVVDEFLQVKGTKNVWAVGDISAIQRAQAIITAKQADHVAMSIGLSHQGKPLIPYKKDEKYTLMVPVGRKAGTGHMGNMKFPSFLISKTKGKAYFTQTMGPMINGSSA